MEKSCHPFPQPSTAWICFFAVIHKLRGIFHSSSIMSPLHHRGKQGLGAWWPSRHLQGKKVEKDFTGLRAGHPDSLLTGKLCFKRSSRLLNFYTWKHTWNDSPQNTENCPKIKLLKLILSAQGFSKTSPSTKMTTGMSICKTRQGRRAAPPNRSSIFPSPKGGNLRIKHPPQQLPTQISSPDCLQWGRQEMQTWKVSAHWGLMETGHFTSSVTCNNQQHIRRDKRCWLCSLSQSQYFHCKPFFHYFKKSAVKICSRLELGTQRLCLK